MTRSALVPLLLAALLSLSLTGCREEKPDPAANDAKPVLYLYPERKPKSTSDWTTAGS